MKPFESSTSSNGGGVTSNGAAADGLPLYLVDWIEAALSEQEPKLSLKSAQPDFEKLWTEGILNPIRGITKSTSSSDESDSKAGDFPTLSMCTRCLLFCLDCNLPKIIMFVLLSVALITVMVLGIVFRAFADAAEVDNFRKAEIQTTGNSSQDSEVTDDDDSDEERSDSDDDPNNIGPAHTNRPSQINCRTVTESEDTHCQNNTAKGLTLLSSSTQNHHDSVPQSQTQSQYQGPGHPGQPGNGSLSLSSVGASPPASENSPGSGKGSSAPASQSPPASRTSPGSGEGNHREFHDSIKSNGSGTGSSKKVVGPGMLTSQGSDVLEPNEDDDKEVSDLHEMLKKTVIPSQTLEFLAESPTSVNSPESGKGSSAPTSQSPPKSSGSSPGSVNGNFNNYTFYPDSHSNYVSEAISENQCEISELQSDKRVNQVQGHLSETSLKTSSSAYHSSSSSSQIQTQIQSSCYSNRSSEAAVQGKGRGQGGLTDAAPNNKGGDGIMTRVSS